MPYIGDDYLTVKEYRALREKYREARTPTPWKAWATWYLSPAGKRDRAAVERAREYEARNKRAVMATIRGMQQAEDEEHRRREELAALRQQANERDGVTFDYTDRALAAQRQLAQMGG
jgi:hypothetical protein